MPGVPETEEFPFDVWTRLHSRFWRHPSATLLRLGAPAGLQALRQTIARYLATFRGLTCDWRQVIVTTGARSEEHTSELQSLMRISYAVFCLKKKNTTHNNYLQRTTTNTTNMQLSP